MKRTGLIGLLFMFGAVVSVQGQQVDSRWAPWLGCWQLVDESARPGSPARAAAKPENTRVCAVATSEAAGVTLTTRIEDQAVLQQTIVTDGMQHPISDADCRGWQRADWSRTGERLFSRAELSCKGEAPRKVSGVAMVMDGTWIDIQAIEIAGRDHIRVRRYIRADQEDQAAASTTRRGSIAPRLGATKFTLEDVKEASAMISPRAVEAALVETKASFDLNSKAVLDLDKAGVPESVIDLMVAVSYPKRFIVDRAGSSSASASTSYGGFGPYALPYDDLLYDTFWASPYAPYYYSPFGYAYWAGYGVPYYPLTGFVTIDPAEPRGTEASGGGRLVNGAGYTRIRPREAESAESGGGRQRIDGFSSTDSSNSGSSGSSGSSGISSQGYSGGGSSTDTGRTAEPR